ncbi:hypothetical protein CLOP_g15698 [Closterium sp. NIES-67]|nr:hypothetical protein CLOP_g15698 [Closterium sp. NIES-67]
MAKQSPGAMSASGVPTGVWGAGEASLTFPSQQLQEGRDLGAWAAVCLDCKWEKSDIRSPISVMGDFLVSLLPGHVSASFSCVRVPAADGICDSDVTDPDGSRTAVSEGEVGLVAVYGAVDGGLLGDYKVSIPGHPYALVPQGIMGVSPTVPGATPEQVVGQPSVEDFKFLGAVASAGGWEWKAEAEGQGNGEVWSFEAE